MKQKMVTTNLRVPEVHYTQLKSLAGELGMSVNEFMTEMIRNIPLKMITGLKNVPISAKKKVRGYEALEKLALESEKWQWKGTMSEDDEIIYG